MTLAHLGHWYSELLYVAPVALTAGWLWLQSRKEKKRDEAEAPR